MDCVEPEIMDSKILKARLTPFYARHKTHIQAHKYMIEPGKASFSS